MEPGNPDFVMSARLTGLLIAILLLLLLAWSLRTPPEVDSASHRIPAADAANEGLPSAAPAVERSVTSDILPVEKAEVRFQLRRGSTLVLLSGQLHVDSALTGSARYAVVDGHGTMTPIAAEHLLAHGRAAVVPANVHWEAGATAVLSAQSDPESGILELQVAPTLELRIRVANLAGQPLVGARVVPITDFALLEPRSACLTDRDGNAIVHLAIRGGRVQFRAEMPGFVGHQQSIAVTAAVQDLEIQLRRVLGYAVAVDRTWRGRLASDFGVGGIGAGVPRTAHSDLRDRLIRSKIFDPSAESMSLHLFSELEWIDAATGHVGLIVGDALVASMAVPVLPIDHPEFAVHRFPPEAAQSLRSHPSIEFELHPATAFLADAPDELRIRLRVHEGDPDEPGDPGYSYAECHRVTGTRYRASLPVGEYEFLSEGQDWDMSDGSLGDAADPGFLPGQRFAVRAQGAAAPIPAQLAAGETWIHYSIVDPFGRPLDARLLLFPHLDSPHPAESQFGMILRKWPEGRFVRPGQYDLMARVRSAEKCLRIGPVFTWPVADPSPDGHFRIVLPFEGEAFDPFQYQ